ncbi:TIGR03118 family protein [Jatrophihabitans sp. DSM 45814]
MRSSTLRRGTALLTTVAASGFLAWSIPAAADQSDRGSYVETVIVSDQAGIAPVTDTHLVNPWGIAFGPTTPLWVSNNGTSTSTLYSTNTGPTQVPLVVTTQPGPTGVVFNDTTEFTLPDGTPSKFLFDSLSGQLSAWGGGTQTTTTASVSGTVFTGLALAHTKDGARLYAADAATTNVLVYNGKWQLDSILKDRKLPAGLTTYNVAVIGKNIYVSYAPPPGVQSAVHGAIDVYNLDGSLQRRLITGGVLDGPWGMVIAPHTWGRFADALLVGNEDGGQINAFNQHTGRFLGTVRDAHNQPIGADGLWGMAFGNGVIGTPNDLVIAIGTDEYQHGIVALVHPTPKKAHHS